MQSNFSFRSKSASYKPYSSSSQTYTLDLKAIVKQRHQESLINPEREICRPQKAITVEIPKDSNLGFEKEQPAEIRGLSRDQTAIHQLEKLISPRVEDPSVRFETACRSKDPIFMKTKTESQEKKSSQVPPCNFLKSPEYYQAELTKLSMKLTEAQKRNYHLENHLIKLQRKLSELQRQKKQVTDSYVHVKEENKAIKSKYSQLQHLSKQQMLINLELQALIGRVTIKKNQRQKEQSSVIETLKKTIDGREGKFKGKLRALEEEYEKTKNVSEEQITTLLMELKTKSTEINKLKNNIKVLSMEQQNHLEKGISSTIPSNRMENSKQEVETRFSRYGPKVSEDLTQQPEQLFKLTSNVFDQGSTRTRPYSKTDRV